MRGLKGLLIRKIWITGIFWCVPLLTFPASWFVALGVPAPEPLLFTRLLGVAGSWSSWGLGAQIFMSLSAVGALAISVSLIQARQYISKHKRPDQDA